MHFTRTVGALRSPKNQRMHSSAFWARNRKSSRNLATRQSRKSSVAATSSLSSFLSMACSQQASLTNTDYFTQTLPPLFTTIVIANAQLRGEKEVATLYTISTLSPGLEYNEPQLYTDSVQSYQTGRQQVKVSREEETFGKITWTLARQLQHTNSKRATGEFPLRLCVGLPNNRIATTAILMSTTVCGR